MPTTAIRLLTLLLLSIFSVAGAHAQPYTFRFVNHTSYDLSQIYIFAEDVASGDAFNISYQGGSEALSLRTSVTLADILYNGNADLSVQYSKSLALYVGLNATQVTPTIISNHGLPSYVGGPDVPWSGVQYGIVEASVTGTNDNADVSAINSVGVPMNLTNARNNQSVGFTDPSKLATLRNNLATQLPAVAWPNTTDPIRYVGPNTAPVGTLSIPGSTSGLQLPAFTDYFNAFQAQNSHAIIQSNISILSGPSNWRFDYDFQLTISESGELQLVGQVTVSDTQNPGFTPVVVDGLSIAVAADDPLNNTYSASSFIYAAQASLNNADISTAGDWLELQTITGLDFDSEISPNVVDRILGDVSFGFAYGFIASDAFGDKPSGEWYADGQTLVFDQLQPDNPYYSLYSKLIYDTDSHIYSHPYSDRMQDSLFAVSIELSGNDIMEINIYDFSAVVPEPSTFAMLFSFAAIFAIRFRLRRNGR